MRVIRRFLAAAVTGVMVFLLFSVSHRTLVMILMAARVPDGLVDVVHTLRWPVYAVAFLLSVSVFVQYLKEG